jgi:hypothetical protein
MPAFVIHALGAPPRKVVIDSSPIRIGRDTTADIIIQEPSVSRDHAMFLSDEQGRWHVSCVSDTNPIVVDGAVITSGTVAHEGTEVVIGASHMIIFSENAFTANQYIEAKRHFEQGLCEACKWSGMVSSLSKDPRCPRCAASLKAAASGGPDSLHSSQPMDVAQRRKFQVGTEAMPLDQAKRAATSSRSGPTGSASSRAGPSSAVTGRSARRMRSSRRRSWRRPLRSSRPRRSTSSPPPKWMTSTAWIRP